MRQFVGIVLVCFAVLAFRAFYNYCESFVEKRMPPSQNLTNTSAVPNLPGMPSSLEASFAAAEAQGPKTLRRWIDYYGLNITDPRRAAIELDYVVMVSREDMAEARRVFAAVKARTPTNSPVYPRIKRLEQAYE